MKSFKVAVSLFLFSSASAVAADLPSIKSEPSAAPAPMWVGFHAGLNAGGTWGNNSGVSLTTWDIEPQGRDAAFNIAKAASAQLNSGSVSSPIGGAGFIGGGQIGYDWQVPLFGLGVVIGGEADIQGIAGSNGNGSRINNGVLYSYALGADSFSFNLITNQRLSSSLQWLGTVRGRVGLLATPSLLLYGTAGLAYGEISGNYQTTGALFNSRTAGFAALIPNGIVSIPNSQNSFSNTSTGWTAGGGVEWMFMNNWSTKVEYLYYDLGNVAGTGYNYTYNGVGNRPVTLPSITNYQAKVTGNIVRAGVNYHFNFASAPVVAKF
jgi:outer membrane immunogenic protein